MPESPRWLISVGRFEEALKILKDGAKTNGTTLPPDEEVIAMMESFKQEVRLEATSVVDLVTSY